MPLNDRDHKDMQIFLDTADVDVARTHFATGLVDGITTNPTLILKSGRRPHDVYGELKDIGYKDISAEIVGDYYETIKEANILREKFGPCVTIKVPATPDGLQACRDLAKEGFHVNVTLIFNAAQAILAAKAGATYASVFVGRCDDNSVSGTEVVRSVAGVYSVQGVRTRVLAASLRTPYKVSRSFYNGANVCTVPPKVFMDMHSHVLTDQGLVLFKNDWKAAQEALGKSDSEVEEV